MAHSIFYNKKGFFKMLHTGNSLGVRDNQGSAACSCITAFITLNPSKSTNFSIPSSTLPNTYAGTSYTVSDNGSWGLLYDSSNEIPSTAKVETALLIWGMQQNGSGTIPLNSPINFIDANSVTHSISPNLSLNQGPGTAINLNSRYADVTTIVSNSGFGTYAVSSVPNIYLSGAGGCGWGLIVIYEDSSFPFRDVTIFNTNLGTGNSINLSGFYTPISGTVHARVFTMGLWGDSELTGDRLILNGSPLSGPRNPYNNFFCSQICDSNGNLATIGSFGDLNTQPGTAPVLKRAEFDITNVDASGILPNGIRSTTISISNSVDDIYVPALALQINQNSPLISILKTVDKSFTVSPDTLLYTLVIKNTGTADALNFFIQDTLPTNTSYISSSLKINNIPSSNNIESGFYLGVIPLNNGTVTITFNALLNSNIPNLTTITNSAYGKYQFVSDPTSPTTVSAGVISNFVDTVIIEDLTTIVKFVDKPLTYTGVTLTYTCIISNLNSSSSLTNFIFYDSIPQTTNFIPNSVTLNGNTILNADPSLGISLNTIPNNTTITLTFSVLCSGTTGTIPNFATCSYLYSDIAPRTISSNTVFTSYPFINLSPIKYVDKSYATLGSTLTYTLVFTNNSNVDLNNIKFIDTLPSSETFVNSSVIINNIPSSQNINDGIFIGTVPISTTVTVSFQVLIN